MSSLISERLARRILVILLVLKMVFTVFDMIQQGVGYSYDFRHHGWRARSAGLEMGKMAYNPPLYYLPVLPAANVAKYYDHGRPIIADNPNDESDHAQLLLEVVRGFNVIYLLTFYVSWIYFIFPRVTPSRRAWFLASLFLLTLPGYQKASTMAHPDNLLMGLSALATAIWVRMERLQKTRLRDGLLLGFATALIGLTRPFAIVPVAVLSLFNAVAQVRDAVRAKTRSLVKSLLAAIGRVALIGALTATIAGAWYGFRYYETGAIFDAYKESYVDDFQPYKQRFDYAHYYGSFHFLSLLTNPNRNMSGNDRPSENRLGNTFPTIVYSEIWGDHWLYFSGPTQAADPKAWVKRIAFLVALPLSVAFIAMLAVGLIRTAVRAVRRRVTSREVLMATMAVLGFGLFVYWQGHAGLLPGKNSTIKFLYFAYVAPYAIATAFGIRPRERTFHLFVGAILLTFVVTVPIAIVNAAYPIPLRLYD